MSSQELGIAQGLKLILRSLPEEQRLSILRQLNSECLSQDSRRQLALPPVANGAILIADMQAAMNIFHSLEVERNGMCKLTIPAEVPEIVAIAVLDIYFRATYPTSGSSLCGVDALWFAELPGVQSRDLSKPRVIRINPLVDGTLDGETSDKHAVLERAGMALAAPEEVALVVVAYACRYRGADILKGSWTMTSVDGVWLGMDPVNGIRARFIGREFSKVDDKNDTRPVGAAGVARIDPDSQPQHALVG